MNPRRGSVVCGILVFSFIIASVLVGCAKSDEDKSSDTAPDLRELEQVEVVPGEGRAALVAHADKLAVEASRKSGEAAGRLSAQAAELRQRAYLRFGKRADALEALELWSDASLLDAKSACEHGLRVIALRGQLGQEVAKQYRDLYLLRERFKESSCRIRIQKALAVLAHYEPTADVLRELRESAAALEATDQAASSASEHELHSREVVVPEVLRASLDHPTQITEVEPFGAERTARIVVHVTHPTKFQVGTLEATSSRGPRLFVDIEHATFKGPEVIESTGLIERVRLGVKDDASRVVVDLTAPVYHRVFYLPEPFRLVLDLSLDPPNDKASPRQIRRVVLDPGHGGHDPGAVGPNGLREKDVALDIAHRAAPLLAREVGVSTLLTRDVDVFVPLDERAARANAFHADLFVSIHLNSSEDRGSRGVMTFVLDSSRDSAASKIAARENASSEAAAAELANSLSRIESSERRAASETFANLLQRAAGVSLRRKYDDIADHGVRRAGFYVLAGAAMPAVLFEGSFISNPVEARRLNHDDYRQRLADSIVNAVRAYREGL